MRRARGTRGRSSIRRIAGAAIVLALLIGSSTACEPERTTGAGKPGARGPEATPAARMRAVGTGVGWMVGHATEMPPGWAYSNLVRLRRMLPTGREAAILDAALRDAASTLSQRAIPDDLGDPAVLGPQRVTQVLAELLRRRETGLPWQADAAVLGRSIAEDEDAFWAAIALRNQPTVAYLLEALDLPTDDRIGRVTETLHAQARTTPVSELAENYHYVYAITHVVYARSEYFATAVDPVGLAFAIPVLQAALVQRLDGSIGVFDLDLVGEVVASLRLLGADDDELCRRARQTLIDLQDEDGSWGTGEGVTPRRIHPTFNAIAALVTTRPTDAHPPASPAMR